MTVTRAFAITIGSGAVFGSLGAGLGWVLGRLAPDYYRTVFRIPPDARFDPAQTGLALGLIQGLAAGVAIGLVIVVTVTWFEIRRLQAASPVPPKPASDDW